jgi:hypothetical protein
MPPDDKRFAGTDDAAGSSKAPGLREYTQPRPPTVARPADGRHAFPIAQPNNQNKSGLILDSSREVGYTSSNTTPIKRESVSSGD